ncbi:TonB-dependent receptor [Niabella sp. W65]|nr:TonB-dependent receptor [Niabella sp. W65]MCH7361809.1 TonB-dependent receptor [Niabella sp. W65]
MRFGQRYQYQPRELSLQWLQRCKVNNVQGNPNLKNESLNEFEIGTELKFLNNRLSFEGSYFNRESKDLLSQIPINPSSGFYIK